MTIARHNHLLRGRRRFLVFIYEVDFNISYAEFSTRNEKQNRSADHSDVEVDQGGKQHSVYNKSKLKVPSSRCVPFPVEIDLDKILLKYIQAGLKQDTNKNC